MRLQMAAEVWDRLEIAHTSEYLNFLKCYFCVFSVILNQLITMQFVETPEHKLRNIVVEILNRLPHSEVLCPFVLAKDPRELPRFLRAWEGDHSKKVRVRILGWRFRQPGNFPPPPDTPQQQGSNLNHRPPYRHYHRHRSPPSEEDSSHNGGSNSVASGRSFTRRKMNQAKKKTMWVIKKTPPPAKPGMTLALTSNTMACPIGKVTPKIQKIAAIQKISCHMGFAATGQVQYTVKVQGVIQIFSQPPSPFGAVPSPFSIKCKSLSKQNLLYIVNSTGIALDQTHGIRMQAGTNRALKEVPDPFNKPLNYGSKIPLSRPLLNRPCKGPLPRRLSEIETIFSPGFPSIISLYGLSTPSRPLTLEPENISEESEGGLQDSSFEQLPPGFEDNSPPQTNIRRSRRIKEKNSGSYLSATDNAEQLKSLNRGAASPKVGIRSGSSKKSGFRKPNFKYLENVDPLTGCQAELVVLAAGVEMDAALENKISQAMGEEGGELP